MARSEKGPPATKRKGGGIRQRIAAAEAVEAARTISNASSRGQSKLAKFLIESWAKGELSPQKVQHIAELAMCDLSQMGNVQFKTLEKLAALGHHGAAPQNCHRDRLALAKPYSSLPQQSLHCIHFKKRQVVCKEFSCHMKYLQVYFMIIKNLGGKSFYHILKS